jgi:hypothetical protein
MNCKAFVEMDSLSDWQTRFARVEDSILQIENLVGRYSQTRRSSADIADTVETLEAKVGDARRKIMDNESAASTFDREFLERKQTFPSPFVPSKLYTIQDFTFFLLFIAYCIFLVAVVLTVNEKKFEIFSGGIVLGLISLALIVRYA